MDPSVIPPRGRPLSEAERVALMADLEEVIASSHLFKTLDDGGRRELIECGYVVQFPAGELLMEQGSEESPAMYLILSGKVSVETSGGSRGSIRLAVLGRGACLGEVSVLSGGPRTATVLAMEDVKAVTFEAHRIRRVIDAHPKVRRLLEAMIEGRARDTVEKLISS